MVRLPCYCKVYLPSKCKCRLRKRGYRVLRGPGQLQSFSLQGLQDCTATQNHRRLYEVKEESSTSLVETTHMALAGFNLRYGPITGFVKNNRNYFKLMMKDVALLVCFLATNLVVLISIVCTTFVDLLLLIIMGLLWFLRFFVSKGSSVREGGVRKVWLTRTEELITKLGLQDENTNVLANA